MNRAPDATDFHVDVPGIGNFRFAYRGMRDELKIGTEYSRLTEGVDTPTTGLAILAGWIAALKVLTVSAPDGWDMDAMDPLEQESYDKMRRVHAALRDKETSFRQKPTTASQAKRPGDGEIAPVLVPSQVQPVADGPSLS